MLVQSDDIFDFENEKYKEEFMRRIILASHGMLAEGMKDSVTF